MDPDVILVTGPPRSGTSATAGVLAHCGGFVGRCQDGSDANPLGYFENRRIRLEVLQPLLKRYKIDPKGQRPLGQVPPNEIMAEALRSRVLNIMGSEGWNGDQPLVYKDAKLLLCWQLWRQAFPRARWVVTSRDPHQVARSCMRADMMVAYGTVAQWEAYARRYLALGEEVVAAGGWPVEPGAYFGGWSPAEFQRMVEWTGLQWTPEAARFLRSDLWNRRASA